MNESCWPSRRSTRLAPSSVARGGLAVGEADLDTADRLVVGAVDRRLDVRAAPTASRPAAAPTARSGRRARPPTSRLRRAPSNAEASAARHGVSRVQARSVSPGAKSSARCCSAAFGSVGAQDVGDPPLGEDAERVVGDLVRRLAVPPRDDRRVRGEQRQRHRLGVQREPAVHPHDDDFARPEPAADRDLGVEARDRRVDLAADHDQHPHRVPARGDRRGLLGLLDVLVVDDDDERQRDAARHRAAGAPLGGQRLDDRRAGGVPERGHTAASTARPSRASISSASFGPHSPARYRCGSCAGPELLERVDHPPGRLDLLAAREQRRVAEQHVEDQPLVGLGRGLGERLAVEEVHRDVADLHRADPGTFEPNFSVTPSSGCTRITSWLWPSSCGVGLAERQVRRLLEQHRDLGDPLGQPLAGAQVERHAGPAAGLDAEPDGRVGLGLRVARDALLVAERDGPLAGEPALVVLPADRVRRRGPAAARSPAAP